MGKFKQIKNNLCNKNNLFDEVKIPLWVWIVTGLFMLVLFVMHIYGDVLITAKQGLKVWDCIFSGRPLDFYKEAVMYAGGKNYADYLYRAAYPILIYLVFAVWELPVWVIGKILGADIYNTMLSMIWTKLFLAVVLVLAIIAFYHLMCALDKKKYAQLGSFLFMTSTFILSATAVVGQYDIIGVLFTILGLTAWVKEDKKKFFLFFILSFAFKYFSVLLFVPLMLLKEKKITKVIFATVLCMLPTLILMVIFPKPAVQIYNLDLFSRFIRSALPINKNGMVLYLLVAMLGFVYAFLVKPSKEDMPQYAVFTLLIEAGAFCFLTDIYPYWLVIAVPVFILAVFFSAGNENKALWCETIACASIVLINYSNFQQCFNMKTIDEIGLLPMLMGKTVQDVSLGAVPNILSKIPYSIGVFGTFCIFGWILMLFFAKPKQKKYDVFEPMMVSTITIRTLVNLGIAAMPLLMCALILFIH